MCASWAILSAFAGAMSSGEDLVCSALMQGQTGAARCLSPLAGQSACRRRADTTPKVPVATLNFEHAWDCWAKNKVTTRVFCTCSKDVGMLHHSPTEPILLSKAAPKLYSFSLSPTHQVSANMSAATKVTSDIPCAIGMRLLFLEVQWPITWACWMNYVLTPIQVKQQRWQIVWQK